MIHPTSVQQMPFCRASQTNFKRGRIVLYNEAMHSWLTGFKRFIIDSGTVAIIRQWRTHWTMRSHPIYCADARRLGTQQFRRITAPTWRPSKSRNWLLVAVILIAVMIILPDGLFTIGMLAFSFLAILLVGISWIGYIQIAAFSSRIIVREREKQTWEALLALPCAWGDMLV